MIYSHQDTSFFEVFYAAMPRKTPQKTVIFLKPKLTHPERSRRGFLRLRSEGSLR
jgi:hypothetical protein